MSILLFGKEAILMLAKDQIHYAYSSIGSRFVVILLSIGISMALFFHLGLYILIMSTKRIDVLVVSCFQYSSPANQSRSVSVFCFRVLIIDVRPGQLVAATDL